MNLKENNNKADRVGKARGIKVGRHNPPQTGSNCCLFSGGLEPGDELFEGGYLGQCELA